MNRKLVFIFVILLLFLSIRFSLFYKNQPQYLDGQKVDFKTTLLSEPQISINYQRISLFLPNGERISVIAPFYPEFHYGDTLHISGSIKRVESRKSSNQKGRLLTNEKFFLTLYFPKIEAVKNNKTPIKVGLAVTAFVRQKVVSLFEKTLPPMSSSLLLGIVFGIKEGTDKSFFESLRTTGVLHVIAASGMNVTITAGFLSSLFAFFLRRQVALVFSIIGILFYALLAGLEPSIIRATIMGLLVFSSQILGRQSLAVYGLVLAGAAMLFIKPVILFDIGFQLSFMATLGLIYIRPLFERKERIKKFLKKSIIGEEVVTTISAQVATLPILFANFGTYSLWSVLVNGLVLWVVPILMVLGGLGGILGIVFLPLSKIFLWLSLPFLLYFQKVVLLFASFGGVLMLESFPWQLILGYYLLFFGALFFFYKKT